MNPSPPLPIVLAVASAAAADASTHSNGSKYGSNYLAPPPQQTREDGTALAPGFRFHPTDEELVCYYLKRKVFRRPVRFNAIGEVDIYKHEPCALAVFSKLKTRDQEWYFYSALDRKYGNGGRMNRATRNGYWKATGKDREVRTENQLQGMKKTLVYHTGRAPGGQRTNWVMHEYRLSDAEFEKYSATQDAYVLCRIFHKNDIGPPSGNRYAPFIEEEWDVGHTTVVPGLDDVAPGDDMDNSRSNIEQMQDLNKEPLIETREFLPLCKREITNEDLNNPVCVLNTQEPFPLLQYKRRKQTDSGPSHSNNSSDNSVRTTTQDLGSSTTTETVNLKASEATTTAISALLEFSLMEPLDHKERPPPQRPMTHLDSAIPPSIVKLITDLQKEVHKVSVERETLKLEMMSAHAMINILQTRIDVVSTENEHLKRNVRDREK
jgi:hypothetical protein